MVYHNLNTDKLSDTPWRTHHLKDGGTAVTICCPTKNGEIQFERLIAYRKSIKSENKYDWINKQYRQVPGDKTNG